MLGSLLADRLSEAGALLFLTGRDADRIVVAIGSSETDLPSTAFTA